MSTCDGYDGQERTRSRYCTDGVEPRHPTCCRNPERKRHCKMTWNEPITETEKCPTSAYWAEWGDWNGKCTKEKRIHFYTLEFFIQSLTP